MKTLNLTRRLCTLAVAGLLLASMTLAGLAQSAMPSAETLEKLAKEAYAKFKDDKGGKNADYIPALAKVPSNLFGITIVTVEARSSTSATWIMRSPCNRARRCSRCAW
jgi:Glutaminase